MKHNNHDLCYRPGPPAEFRRVSVHSLSKWSGQQQHLLKQLQALSAQEMHFLCTQCLQPLQKMQTSYETRLNSAGGPGQYHRS